jgi:Skp family chaperone for outer membrane proteins
MTMSSRAATALGLASVLSFTTVAHAQTDAAVRKTNAGATAAVTEIPTARIGAIDVERVLKEYKKVQISSEAIRAEVSVRQLQLTKLAQEGQKLMKELDGLDPDSADARDRKNKMKQLQIQMESDKATAQEEFALKESEALAELYKEIQQMTAAVAKQRHLNFVVRISNEPVTASEPNSVMSAMLRTMVYADPKTEITDAVIYYLNQRFDQANAGKPAAKTAAKPAASPAAAAASPAAAEPTAPRGN